MVCRVGEQGNEELGWRQVKVYSRRGQVDTAMHHEVQRARAWGSGVGVLLSCSDGRFEGRRAPAYCTQRAAASVAVRIPVSEVNATRV
jgi:hypothetical protein